MANGTDTTPWATAAGAGLGGTAGAIGAPGLALGALGFGLGAIPAGLAGYGVSQALKGRQQRLQEKEDRLRGKGKWAQAEGVAAKQQFGTDDPQKIATALTLEELRRMQTAPETFGPSGEEIADAGRQAAASAGETAATAMQKALRESGTRTGTESALRGAQTDLGQVAQGASAAVQGTAGKEVEDHMARIYGQLRGTPPPQPSALQTAMLDVGTGLVGDAGKLGLDFMREEQLGMESLYNKPGTTINVGGTGTVVG